MGKGLVLSVEDCVAVDDPEHGEEAKSVDALQVGMGSSSVRVKEPLGVGPDGEGKEPAGQRGVMSFRCGR